MTEIKAPNTSDTQISNLEDDPRTWDIFKWVNVFEDSQNWELPYPTGCLRNTKRNIEILIVTELITWNNNTWIISIDSIVKNTRESIGKFVFKEDVLKYFRLAYRKTVAELLLTGIALNLEEAHPKVDVRF
jgi:hypothetical protein